MDNIDFFNVSAFDNSIRQDIQILKLAEMTQEYLSSRLSTIEHNNEQKDKNLLEVMDSINILTNEIDILKKKYPLQSSNSIEEISVETNGRSNSSLKTNYHNTSNPINETTNDSHKTGITKGSNHNLVSIDFKEKVNYISRSPERKSNNFMLNSSPKNEKIKEPISNHNKLSEKTVIQEIVINNQPKISNKIAENLKKTGFERKGSPNQSKINIAISNFGSNKVTNAKVNVKGKIENMTIINVNSKTEACSPTNNQTKNPKNNPAEKIKELKEKERNSKFKNDILKDNSKTNNFDMKSRSPQNNKNLNFKKLINCSPPRKSFEDQNNDTSVNSNDKYIKIDKKIIISNRKNSNQSNSISTPNNELKSMNNENSSILSVSHEVNISISITNLEKSKFKLFFNNDENTNIYLKLFQFCRIREKLSFKSMNSILRKKFFQSEIFEIQKKIMLKKPEENPFFNFFLKKELETSVKSESLYLSDYIDDKLINENVTFINLINLIHLILYSDNMEIRTLTEKIEKSILIEIFTRN